MATYGIDTDVIEYSFTIPPPKIQSGPRKGHIASMNNISYWIRYQKTQIKNAFLDLLYSWYLDDNPEPRRKYGKIEYRILRDSNRIIDSDALGFTNKWIQDAFVKKGYLIDDNQVLVVYHPTDHSKRNELGETMLEVKAFFSDTPFTIERTVP